MTTKANSASLGSCWLLIVACLAIGVFIVWIVTVSWVLKLLAGVIIVANLAIGLVIGYYVYKTLSEGFPTWASVTAAVILAITVSLAIIEVERSHSLIRYYDLYHTDDDDN